MITAQVLFPGAADGWLAAQTRVIELVLLSFPPFSVARAVACLPPLLFSSPLFPFLPPAFARSCRSNQTRMARGATFQFEVSWTTDNMGLFPSFFFFFFFLLPVFTQLTRAIPMVAFSFAIF